MSTPTPEAIEAAARALAHAFGADDCFERVDEWEALEDWEREAHPDERPGLDYEDCSHYRRSATAALSAAYRLMVAQAKGEAWDEGCRVGKAHGYNVFTLTPCPTNPYRAATIESEATK